MHWIKLQSFFFFEGRDPFFLLNYSEKDELVAWFICLFLVFFFFLLVVHTLCDVVRFTPQSTLLASSWSRRRMNREQKQT